MGKRLGKNYINTLFNTAMLYMLTAAKTIFPLITLPYLARVLSVECYGMVSYVKAIRSYAQIIIDFGFMLSAVKEVVEAKTDKNKISEIIGNTVVSKLILSAVAFVVIFTIGNFIDILKGNLLYLCLTLCVPILSSFLMDFLFRGIEKMHIITIIFVLMKVISTALTFLVIKNDSHILLIPTFDIISSIVAIAVTWIIVWKMGFGFKCTGLYTCWLKIKSSFSYFANSMASTALGTLVTVVMGIFVKDLQQIAFWGVCMQLVGAIQSMYTPISNGIYPHMIRHKDFKLIKNIMLIFMPLITICSGIAYVISPTILTIVAGNKYVAAATMFRSLLPVIVMSFGTMVLGWPALGAIGKIKETTLSTVMGAVVQIIGMAILILIGAFNVLTIAILRNFSEFTMVAMRVVYLYKYRGLFNKNINSGEGV